MSKSSISLAESDSDDRSVEDTKNAKRAAYATMATTVIPREEKKNSLGPEFMARSSIESRSRTMVQKKTS